MRKNIDVYTQIAQADALKEAAKNTGAAGSTMGAGIGMGMGLGMGQAFANMSRGIAQPTQPQAKPTAQTNTKHCIHCGAQISASAKFCPECGKPTAEENVCPQCGAKLPAKGKFCPECGHKVR